MRTLLCEKLGLTPGPAPVVGMVSRLVWQKGIDLALPALAQALAEGSIAAAVLGSGERELESALSGLGQRFPGRLAFRQGHDEALAHWIEAGSDAFLMPSRYEPCGLNQMYSLRYGTVPLVRATGGLADSVQDFDESRETGTGIVFRDADSNAVAWALGRMVELFRTPARWNRLRANGMAVELGWERPAGQYVDLYQRLLRQPVP
jgi:starch synthase